jgi:predicted RNA-binding Zn ribbon-like protein
MVIEGTTSAKGAQQATFAITAALLATATAESAGDAERDRLASAQSATVWLEQLRADARTGPLSDVQLDASGLAHLRRFRETLRSAFRADRAGAQPAAESAPFTSTVELRWTPAGTNVTPLGSGWRRIVAAVTSELLLAEASGQMRRLKTCAYEPCGYPFIDASRNLSRVWHDTARCGNVVNLRASRARKTQQDASDE